MNEGDPVSVPGIEAETVSVDLDKIRQSGFVVLIGEGALNEEDDQWMRDALGGLSGKVKVEPSADPASETLEATEGQ